MLLDVDTSETLTAAVSVAFTALLTETLLASATDNEFVSDADTVAAAAEASAIDKEWVWLAVIPAVVAVVSETLTALVSDAEILMATLLASETDRATLSVPGEDRLGFEISDTETAPMSVVETDTAGVDASAILNECVWLVVT